MIDPVWRSPWISASGLAMNLSLSREIATCRSRSSRKPAAVASSQGDVQRFCSACEIWFGKDQILGDLAERMVAGKRGDALFLLRGGNRKVGTEEQRPRQEGRDVIDEARVTGAGNQPLAQDDMRLEQLHGDEGETLIVVQHRRHQAGRQPGLMDQRQILVVRARQRQRPALADQSHIRQRLLDGNTARRSLDDEHEIEVAVADFTDRPGLRRSSQPGDDVRNLGEVGAQIRIVQNAIFIRSGAARRLRLRRHGCRPITIL